MLTKIFILCYKYIFKKIKFMYVGFINIYKPFFLFVKYTVFFLGMIKISFKVNLFLSFFNILKTFKIKKKIVNTNKTLIQFFFSNL